MTMAADNEFVITRVLTAPRAQVWQAWTEPGSLARWWGPNVITTPVCEMDLRPGGAYRVVMRTPAGTMVLTVRFEHLGGNKTQLSISTRFESTAIRDAMVTMGMHEGWSQSLGRLAQHVEAG
jgi:uncharacterized protein YndB with AHSA1/START domain